jgi:oligosaccharyltransferase complex subunit gamma
MRFLTPLLALGLAILPAALADRQKWVDLASKSKNGIIKLDSAMYDELLDSDRDYSALVLLTALAPQFKCQPCQWVLSWL